MLEGNATLIAARLIEARLRAQMCTFADQFEGRPRTEEEAYAIQDELQAMFRARVGGEVSGYKVGLVTSAIRDQCGGRDRLGIDWPVYGRLFSNYTFLNTAALSLSQFVRPSVECELAIRIGSDVPRRDREYDEKSIASHVSACMAGIELVDFHIPFFEYSSPLAPLFIADNGSNWGCVLGSPIENWQSLNLAELQGSLFKNGNLLDSGKGEVLNGHPLKVLAWLQNHLSKMGKTLRAEEIIMLGSVTPNFPISSSCTIEVDWGVLGKASVQFD